MQLVESLIDYLISVCLSDGRESLTSLTRPLMFIPQLIWGDIQQVMQATPLYLPLSFV